MPIAVIHLLAAVAPNDREVRARELDVFAVRVAIILPGATSIWRCSLATSMVNGDSSSWREVVIQCPQMRKRAEWSSSRHHSTSHIRSC